MVNDVLRGRACDTLQQQQRLTIDELSKTVTVADSVIEKKEQLISILEGRLKNQQYDCAIDKRLNEEKLKRARKRTLVLSGISVFELMLLLVFI